MTVCQRGGGEAVFLPGPVLGVPCADGCRSQHLVCWTDETARLHVRAVPPLTTPDLADALRACGYRQPGDRR